MFSVSVFYDERIVVVAEQRPDASEEDSFQWMSRVLQVSFVVKGGSKMLDIFFGGLVIPPYFFLANHYLNMLGAINKTR